MKIKRMPLEERPREKLLYYGKDALSNTELLAILLRTGTREKSALELSNEVLSLNEDGLVNLCECTPEELSGIPGIGEAKACQIIAAAELGRRIATYPRKQKVSVGNPQDIVQLYMEKMRYFKEEHFCALLLDTKGRVIEDVEVSIGDLNSAPVHPREVFRQAVRRSAAAVALVHNHPSGDPEPSREDLEITMQLQDTAEVLGIQLVDHIIIGDGVYTSLKTEELM